MVVCSVLKNALYNHTLKNDDSSFDEYVYTHYT